MKLLHKKMKNTENRMMPRYMAVTGMELAMLLDSIETNTEIIFYLDDLQHMAPWETPKAAYFLSRITRYGGDHLIMGNDHHVQICDVSDLVPPERGIDTANAWDFGKFILHCLSDYNVQRVFVPIEQEVAV